MTAKVSPRLLGLIKAVGDAVEAGAPLTTDQYFVLAQALDPTKYGGPYVERRPKANVSHVVLHASAIELYTGLGPAAVFHAEKVNAFFGAEPRMTAHQRLAMVNGPRGDW